MGASRLRQRSVACWRASRVENPGPQVGTARHFAGGLRPDGEFAVLLVGLTDDVRRGAGTQRKVIVRMGFALAPRALYDVVAARTPKWWREGAGAQLAAVESQGLAKRCEAACSMPSSEDGHERLDGEALHASWRRSGLHVPLARRRAHGSERNGVIANPFAHFHAFAHMQSRTPRHANTHIHTDVQPCLHGAPALEAFRRRQRMFGTASGTHVGILLTHGVEASPRLACEKACVSAPSYIRSEHAWHSVSEVQSASRCWAFRCPPPCPLVRAQGNVCRDRGRGRRDRPPRGAVRAVPNARSGRPRERGGR